MSAPSAIEVARQVAAGALSARDVTDACLARIEAREPEVRAFAHLDPAHARRQADALDAHRKAGRPLGPLHGIPVGIKDIIDTADYPTENGSPLDAGRRPQADATLVTRLRAAGAVIIGKTVTTEFAYIEPGPTRNPHNPGHTPGGSSQGSAAAVGDGMVPLAVGTQTVGSVIRPASFCGVVAIKPTFGTISAAGVLDVSTPLDTIGAFAANLPDAALLINAMQGYDPADPRTRMVAHDDLVAAANGQPLVKPTLAVVGGPFWDEASADMKALIGEVADALGERAERVDLPGVYDNALPAHLTMMKAQFATKLGHYRRRDEDAVSAVMRAAMDEGAAVTAVDYLAACDWQNALRAGLAKIFDRFDAIITPSAAGEASETLASTGDSRFNALWTFVGAPCVTLPLGKGQNGLPLGVQVVGRPGEDGRLIRTAAWLSRTLAA